MLNIWAQLVRVPNLLTVILDPVVGYVCVTGGADLSASILASTAVLLFYAAGLLLSDAADTQKDASERPERPIPSGKISVGVVAAVGWVFLVLGMLICMFGGRQMAIAGAILSTTVVLYVYLHSKLPLIGATLMGLCRAMAIMVGAGLAGAMSAAFLPAITSFVYIFLLTIAAAGEAAKPNIGLWVGTAPLIALGIPFFYGLHSDNFIFSLFFMLLAIISTTYSASMCSKGRVGVPSHIGLMVRNIIFLQGGWIMLFLEAGNLGAVGGMEVGIIGLRAASGLLSERYASS